MFKTSPGVEVYWIVASLPVTSSAVGRRWPARSLSLIPRVRCSRLRGALMSTRRNSMSVWTGVSGDFTLLASRQPVASRFLATCRGSRVHSVRRYQGEHVALSCLGLVRGRTASSVQLRMPSLWLLPILYITLRKRAHGEEARSRSAMTRCVRCFGTILQALADVTLAALFNVFLDETLDEGPDEKIRFAVIVCAFLRRPCGSTSRSRISTVLSF